MKTPGSAAFPEKHGGKCLVLHLAPEIDNLEETPRAVACTKKYEGEV